MKLTGQEFLGRFLQHVLPQGFRRVRQYGVYAGGQQELLETVRGELTEWLLTQSPNKSQETSQGEPKEVGDGPPCPDCGRPMVMGAQRSPEQEPEWQDSS